MRLRSAPHELLVLFHGTLFSPVTINMPALNVTSRFERLQICHFRIQVVFKYKYVTEDAGNRFASIYRSKK